MSRPIPIPKRSPWVNQILVIRALLHREVATRFGEYRLGFFWMLFEPILGVIIVGVLIGSLGARAVPEIPYPFFVLNGMLLMGLLTGPFSAGVNAINSNRGLLVYPSVRPLDTFIARFIFEFLLLILKKRKKSLWFYKDHFYSSLRSFSLSRLCRVIFNSICYIIQLFIPLN